MSAPALGAYAASDAAQRKITQPVVAWASRRPSDEEPRARGRQALSRPSTSAAPSRAMRERGTIRLKPAASARSLAATSTCE